MNTGSRGISLIKQFEACRLNAYLPTPNDVPTIGYGHTHGVKMGDTCTQEQAENWLTKEDVLDAEQDVNMLVKVPLLQNQFDALVSFTMNLGGHALEVSTLLHKLNAGDYVGAAAEFGKWIYQGKQVLPGLVRRREAERVLFERAA